MKIAYLILAHAHPTHLQRLIRTLSSADTYFYIHLDAKADAASFPDLMGERVIICSRRIDCAWGDISLVDATLELARTALAGPRCDYYALMSGSCYPIQPNKYIDELLRHSSGTEFIEAFPFPDARFGKPIDRIKRLYFRRDPPFVRLKWKLHTWIRALLPSRDYLAHFHGFDLVCGSQWWTLSHAALDYTVRFIDDHPALYRFCKRVDCPDEFVIQVILWNSPFRSRISHSLTFTHWLPGGNGPVAIDDALLERFKSRVVLDSSQNNAPGEKREVVFARKFTDESVDLVQRLDAFIDAKREFPATPLSACIDPVT